MPRGRARRPSTFTPTTAGTYRVIASYSGDPNYNPASTSCADPAEAVVVAKAPLPIATVVSPTPITLGSSFHDTATLGPAPAGAVAPTGTVTFNVYGPADPTCAAAPVFTSTNAVNVAGTSATSSNFMPTTTGTYRVIATYSGDANYLGSSSSCADPAEAAVVNKAPLPIATAVAPTPITLGSSFHDTATLGPPPAGAAPPTGTVVFNVYGPADPTCAAAPVFTSTNAVNAAGTSATSGTFMPTTTGTYRVIATYSGDANYLGSSSSCSDPAEAVVAKAPLPIATAVSPTPITIGSSFHDTATLGPAPAGAPAPTGTVTFNVYGPGDPTCAAAPVFMSANPLNAAGTSATSGTFTPTATGTYRVIATYSGDANYLGSASACSDPAEAEVVARAPLPIATAVAPTPIALGSSFHDTATLGPAPAGAPAPTGTVTFNVYGPGDPTCAAAPVFTSTNAVNPAGTTATSSNFTPLAPGTYRVIATYSGDANYLGVLDGLLRSGRGRGRDQGAAADRHRGRPDADRAGLLLPRHGDPRPRAGGRAGADGDRDLQRVRPGDPTCAAAPVFTSTNAVNADERDLGHVHPDDDGCLPGDRHLQRRRQLPRLGVLVRRPGRGRGRQQGAAADRHRGRPDPDHHRLLLPRHRDARPQAGGCGHADRDGDLQRLRPGRSDVRGGAGLRLGQPRQRRRDRRDVGHVHADGDGHLPGDRHLQRRRQLHGLGLLVRGPGRGRGRGQGAAARRDHRFADADHHRGLLP